MSFFTKSNLVITVFYIVHFLRISWFPIIPAFFSFIFTYKFKLYNIKSIFYVFAYCALGFILFLINSDFSNGVRPALIDFKQFFLLLIYPSFYYFNKTFPININLVAKNIILLSLFSSILIGLGVFPQNTIIRTDATFLIASSFIILIPKNKEDLKFFSPYYFLIFYLLLAYLGRTTILALVVALFYYIIKIRKIPLVSSFIKRLYFIFFVLFLLLGIVIFAIRASDIFASTGTSFVENESRFLAMFLFFSQVIPQLNIFELIFGVGFGVDFSQYMDTDNFIINIHINNIISGNNNIYPALGFHNEFIRIFLLTGLTGSYFMFLFLRSFFQKINYSDAYHSYNCIRLNSFLILVLVSMFGHGFFGSTITSVWALFVLSNLKSEIKSRKLKNNLQ